MGLQEIVKGSLLHPTNVYGTATNVSLRWPIGRGRRYIHPGSNALATFPFPDPEIRADVIANKVAQCLFIEWFMGTEKNTEIEPTHDARMGP